MMLTEKHLPLRAGIIGCGRIAGSIEEEARNGPGFFALPYGHAPAYRLAEGVRLVAAADPQAEAARRFAERWDVPAAYDSLETMLENEELDIVSVCAPTRYHADVFLRLARQPGLRGVYLEKPVAWSLPEARAMQAAAREAGVHVVVNHTRTFDPLWRQVKRLLDDGQLGTVRSIHARWVEGWSFGGSHLFDLVRFLIESDPVHVYAETDDDPGGDVGGVAQLRYRDGTYLTVTMLSELSGTEVSILGTDGRITVNAHGPQLFRNLGGVEVALAFPATMYWTSGMVAAVEELVGAIHRQTPISSGLDDGIAALEVAVALNLSASGGARVQLPIDDESWTVPAA